MEKIKTWLPVFPGFYNTLFEPDESNEIDYINEQREEKGLEALAFDSFVFDYDDYYKEIALACVEHIERALKDFVSSIHFEKISSPKEYNFHNDSINIIVELSKSDKKAVFNYLLRHIEEFDDYLKGHYTSRSGFISSYSNQALDWLGDKDLLTHRHKLGAALQFIYYNEENTTEDLYYACDHVRLFCANYHELTPD